MNNAQHAECCGGVPGNVGEFHIVWRVVTLLSYSLKLDSDVISQSNTSRTGTTNGSI